ncbi:MAG: phosphatidylglycerophosphatase A [Bacilli bacterium]|nr:phosphatidylglycerophosphatase A [Bacilli bacterium]
MKVDYTELKKVAIDLLAERGVTLEDIAKITLEIQSQYYDDITLEYCLEHVNHVLSKREVINAVLTGINLDIMAEQGHIKEPLRSILMNDYSLYGIDEVLAYSIINVYGSIGLTNYGYVDKLKVGILKDINDKIKYHERCNTFLDDIVGAIAAAAAGRIAHSKN